MTTETIDVEATSTPDTKGPGPVTMAVATRGQMGLGKAMTVEELHERLEFIRQVMKKEMKEGQDYGKIPGTGDKPSLLQPGAQKLLMTFNFREQVKKEVLRELPHSSIFGHREYEFTVVVFPAGLRPEDGWDGVGTCSTMESKYRYRKATRKCPECGKEAIIAGKEEFGGGFSCWKKKDGCGAKFHAEHPAIISQSVEDVENEDPADCWNTVRKMAFKRALVAAAINATNTSELWTQDVEDMADNKGRQKAQSGQGKQQPANFASTCPIIAVLSRDEYNRMYTLRKAHSRSATASEIKILLARVQQAGIQREISQTQSEAPYLYTHDGNDIGTSSERRLVGPRLQGFQGPVAVLLVRPDSVSERKPAQGGGDNRLPNRDGQTDVSETRPSELRHPGNSGPQQGNSLSGSPKTIVPQQAIFADPQTRERMIVQLQDSLGLATEFFQKAGCILETEKLEDLPLRFVPVTRRQFQSLQAAITGFGNGEEALLPYPPNPEPQPKRETKTAKSETKPPQPATKAPEPETKPQPKDPEWFWDVVISVPRKGMKRIEYDKKPDTIGSLYNEMKEGNKDAQSRLWGLVNHWDAVPRQVGNKTYQPSEADKKCRAALDAFAAYEEKYREQTDGSELFNNETGEDQQF